MSWEVLVELERGRQNGQIVDPIWWGGTAEEYADLFLRTYHAIKDADLEADVMPAGTYIYGHVLQAGNRSFAEAALKGIHASPLFGPDVVFSYPIHHYPGTSGYPIGSLATSLSAAREILTTSGFGTAPIVISDLGIFVSTTLPASIRETASANMLIAYAHALSQGIKSIVWAQTSDGDYEGYYEAGLVNRDPAGQWPEIPNVLYYSYKLMTDKLGGTDWNQVSIISAGWNGIYAYKFPVRNSTKSVYLVSWNKPPRNRAQAKLVYLKSLGMGIGAKVVVTDAVLPTADLANPDLAYPTCFSSYTATGRFYIGKDPVFLETLP
jgi:hypothetical protein